MRLFTHNVWFKGAHRCPPYWFMFWGKSLSKPQTSCKQTPPFRLHLPTVQHTGTIKISAHWVAHYRNCMFSGGPAEKHSGIWEWEGSLLSSCFHVTESRWSCVATADMSIRGHKSTPLHSSLTSFIRWKTKLSADAQCSIHPDTEVLQHPPVEHCHCWSTLWNGQTVGWLLFTG